MTSLEAALPVSCDLEMQVLMHMGMGAGAGAGAQLTASQAHVNAFEAALADFYATSAVATADQRGRKLLSIFDCVSLFISTVPFGIPQAGINLGCVLKSIGGFFKKLFSKAESEESSHADASGMES